jgi:hypothetical protein
LKPNSTWTLTRKRVFSNAPIQPNVHESLGYPPIPCNYTWTAKSSALVLSNNFKKHPRFPSTLNMSPNEINGNHPSQQRSTGTLIHRLSVAFTQTGLRLQNCATISSWPRIGTTLSLPNTASTAGKLKTGTTLSSAHLHPGKDGGTLFSPNLGKPTIPTRPTTT